MISPLDRSVVLAVLFAVPACGTLVPAEPLVNAAEQAGEAHGAGPESPDPSGAGELAAESSSSGEPGGARSVAPDSPGGASLPGGPGAAEAPAGSFELTMAAAVDGQRYDYLLEVPESATRPEAGWPLLVFLHGAGERGDELARVGRHGPPKLTAEVPELGQCVLAAPQCPSDQWWQASTLGAFVDELLARPDVDPDRVYLTGLSMGGYGTWGLLAAYPDRFAAAVPICGGGQTGRLWPDWPNDFELDALLLAKGVPVRVFHGEDDALIPLEESRVLVDALREIGADVELTVYPGVGHDSWTCTYADPALYTWLFDQSR